MLNNALLVALLATFRFESEDNYKFRFVGRNFRSARAQNLKLVFVVRAEGRKYVKEHDGEWITCTRKVKLTAVNRE